MSNTKDTDRAKHLWNEDDMDEALRLIREEDYSVYAATTAMKIPRKTVEFRFKGTRLDDIVT
jgi:predicted DNA-binding protein (UPF0251 family)